MASTTDNAKASISPAQIAALSVSVFAILLFTSISIYLCGRRKGCKVATQRAARSIVHLHLHPHTRIPDDASAANRQGTSGGNGGGGQLPKLIKQIFGIKVAAAAATEEAPPPPSSSSSSSVEKEQNPKTTGTRATSPLQIGIHPGPGNRFSGTEEFQAAVHNLLGYRPGELQEWYSESDDDDAHDALQEEEEEQDDGTFAAMGQCGSPLPAYQEVAETEPPHRFSWQGQESDYRPEKR